MNTATNRSSPTTKKKNTPPVKAVTTRCKSRIFPSNCQSPSREIFFIERHWIIYWTPISKFHFDRHHRRHGLIFRNTQISFVQVREVVKTSNDQMLEQTMVLLAAKHRFVTRRSLRSSNPFLSFRHTRSTTSSVSVSVDLRSSIRSVSILAQWKRDSFFSWPLSIVFSSVVVGSRYASWPFEFSLSSHSRRW